MLTGNLVPLPLRGPSSISSIPIGIASTGCPLWLNGAVFEVKPTCPIKYVRKRFSDRAQQTPYLLSDELQRRCIRSAMAVCDIWEIWKNQDVINIKCFVVILLELQREITGFAEEAWKGLLSIGPLRKMFLVLYFLSGKTRLMKEKRHTSGKYYPISPAIWARFSHSAQSTRNLFFQYSYPS